jgi:phytoene desaturase
MLVNRYFKDFRHRFLYSFHPLFVGGNPFYTPSVYLMIPYLERRGGVWFSRGGMYSLVEAMGKLFTELGGEIRTEHEVTRIGVTDGAPGDPRGGRGERFEADLVVSNGDVGHTYRDLVEPGTGRSGRTGRWRSWTTPCPASSSTWARGSSTRRWSTTR